MLTYYGKDASGTEVLNITSMVNGIPTPVQTTIPNVLKIESVGDVIQDPIEFPTVARKRRLLDNSGLTDTASLLVHQDGICGVWQSFMIDVLKTQGVVANALEIVVKDNLSVSSFKVKSTALGQGNATPKECIWPNHAVVEFDNNVYDPSYGLEYGIKTYALADFMIKSIDSIGSFRRKYQNEVTQGYGYVYTAAMGPYLIGDYYFEWF
ncbi:MAG: hypothetical protein J6X44_11750 [Thermoguttaceae bacterium]|nr:hypothetical protein [Thermoguttaceae bacterium]